MKCLSIRAPWWWFILHRGKNIENRVWRNCRYRGTILIHASKYWNTGEIRDDFEQAREIAMAHGKPLADLPYSHLTIMKEFGGHIVGQADIVDCVKESDNPWFFGPTGLVLDKVHAFEWPVHTVGQLGLFDVPKRLVKDQLA